MSDDDNKVQCGVHGKSSATFICHHLSEGEKLGFNVGFDPNEPDDLYPDAWCDQCDEVLEQEGEWNDKSEAFADIKLVCAGCYCEIREKNWNQDDEALHELISTSFEYLQKAQDSFMKTYKVGEHERWDWYQETGKLIFSHEGEPVVECDIDFVGTYSNLSNTWMWAWANSSFTENIKEKSRKVRALGEKRSFLKLASAIWSSDPVDGWEMTAIMAKELGAIGAYRTPDDNGFVYMVVNNARWVKRL
jgi:hypothetical protein